MNLSLPSFEGQIAGLRHLIDLSLSSKRSKPPRVTFLSSIAVVGRWTLACAPQEVLLSSADFVLPYGYAYGKYIGEKVIESAVTNRPELDATIVRSGQISGSLGTGAWSLLRVSAKLGVVPDALLEP